MKKTHKIIGVVVLGLLLIFIVFALKADDYIEGKIAEELNNIPSHISIEYDDMEFNTFKGNLIFKNSEIKFRDVDTDSVVSSIKIKDIAILDIDYWEYLKNKNFIVQSLELNHPILRHRQIKVKNDSVKSDSIKQVKDEPWKQYLEIAKLKVKNAEVEISDFETDTLYFSAKNSDININEVRIDSTVGDLIPFKYKSYSGSLSELYYKVGEYEGLNIAEVQFLPQDIKLNEIKIKTKYNRKAYDRILVDERDWYNISLDSVRLKNSEFGKLNDSINKFISDTTYLYHPRIEIYRNKLISDENKYKPYYSEVLRNLDFELTLNTIFLENGYISYEEKVIQGHDPGKLDFSEFYATVHNFSNTYQEGQITSLDIRSNFMETTPLKVNWTFDMNNLQDAYDFKGELGGLNTGVLNQFTNSNLNVMLEGVLHKTYFHIEGNNNSSNINLRINYDDFRIQLINDKKNKPKKLLNAIVNIFIKKDSESDEGNFRESSETVMRNRQGSFYNNLWRNLESGLKSALTGDSKK